ncbi:MAG: TIM barrel protein [Clostridiales bacterium]|jgi:deoxyribonuclease-4|nr:TIM barrel protein [Clostridiales bacterium]
MIKFGPAGNSASFYAEGHTKSTETPEWLKNRGLDCFEYSLGRGINIGGETAAEIGREAAKCGIEMSVHAPYFINFANPESFEKSFGYIVGSLNVLKSLGGTRLVFHVGSQQKQTREDALKNTLYALSKAADKLKTDYPEFDGCKLCPETMGKIGQIGSVDEIIEICKTDDIFVPCIDFGHVNAREHGILKDGGGYAEILSKYLGELGERAVRMHVHFSKIEYSAGGEVRHLTFADNIYGPYFEHLAPLLIQNRMQPYIICESDGTQAEDAAEMKGYYLGLIG